jgi:hypothetical protein
VVSLKLLLFEGMIMDLQQVIPILRDLGIPAAISAVLLALVKAVSDALQRRSKQSLIDWLAQPSAMEPFKGDDRALRALHELQQLLVFERAFGLRAESGYRNELLLFAESQHEFFRLPDVLDAGRLFSRARLRRVISPKVPNRFKNISRMAKWIGYFNLGIGYILIFGSWYYLPERGFLEWELFAVGVACGLSMIGSGFYLFKVARRTEIAAAFLSWRSENQRTSLPRENSNAVQADDGAVA